MKGAMVFDKTHVESFTNDLLEWWRVNGKSFPAWAEAARVAFSISPNSASCERVFALLKHIQAALMLRYNGRCVG